MKQVVTIASGVFSITNTELPKLGNNDILAEVKSSGICGSDLSIHRSPNFPGKLELPCVLGHEWSGKVIAIGSSVNNFSIGDRIVSEEIFWCGECENCRMGAFDFCKNALELGFTIDGAHSTHVRIPSKFCHKLPSKISYDVGALIEPLSVAYNGIYLAGKGISPGKKVLIIGLGPIGLSAALWARASGALVFGIDPNSYRRELAKKNGFNTFDSNKIEEVQDILQNIDLLVEASGIHDEISNFLDFMATKATIVVLGHSTDKIVFNMEQVVLKGITVVGNCGQIGHNTYKYVINALKYKIIDPSFMITNKYNLSDVENVFDFALKNDNYCKIQFDME